MASNCVLEDTGPFLWILGIQNKIVLGITWKSLCKQIEQGTPAHDGNNVPAEAMLLDHKVSRAHILLAFILRWLGGVCDGD